MNEMNNGENNNQNFEQQNNVVQPEQQYVQQQYVQSEQPVSEPLKQEEKKSYCGLLVVFMVISLLLAGYIVYDKTTKKEEPPKHEEDNSSLNNDSENNKVTEAELIDNYRIISDDEYNFYLVKKSTSSSADYEVVKLLGKKYESFENYFGFYKNRIYYSDLKNIKYIDLTDTNLAEKVWIKVPKELYNSDFEEDEEYTPFHEARIFGDNLYIRYIGGEKFTVLNLNATSFDEQKVIKDEKLGQYVYEKWFADDNEENIYYLISNNDGKQNSLYKYNVKNGTSEISVDLINYNYFYNIKNSVVYCKETGENQSSKKVYNLLLYNLRTKETTKITDIVTNGSCGAHFTVQGDNIYYYNDNTGVITQYNVENKTASEYYSVVAKNQYATGLTFVDDNNMIFSYSNSPTKYEYVSNKNKVEELPTIKTLMLDNSSKEIKLEKISSIKKSIAN